MRLRRVDGRLFRKLRIKVVFPPKTFPTRVHKITAPNKKAFNENGIDNILLSISTDLGQKFPMWEFRLAPLAPVGNTFAANIVYAGINRAYVEPKENDDGKRQTL